MALMMTIATLVAMSATGAEAARLKIPLPPSQYDHPSPICHGTRPHLPCMRVADVRNMDIVCGVAGHKLVQPGAPVLGCAIVHQNGFCQVAIRSGLSRVTRAEVIRHEQGHCNGWVHK